MKKLILTLFLVLTLTCQSAEQKFISLTARITGYNQINEIQEVNELLKKGWKIISFSAAGGNQAGTNANIFILLEKQ